MTVAQLLDSVRDHYQAQFRKTISEVQEAGVEAMAEAAWREEDGTLAREGDLNLPIRLDIVTVSDGEAKDRVRVDSQTMLAFDTIDCEWSGGVVVCPFANARRCRSGRIATDCAVGWCV